MYVSLTNLLDFEVFSHKQIVAGHNKLSNLVSGIYSSISAPSYRKKGIYLLELNQVPSDREEVELVLDKLFSAGISALFIKKDFQCHDLKNVIPLLEKYGTELELPIILFSTNRNIYEIMYLVTEEIHKEHPFEYKTFKKIYSDFSSLSLKCRGIEAIINYFQELAGNPIAVYDSDYSCIATTDEDFRDYFNQYSEVHKTSIKENLNNYLFYYKERISTSFSDNCQNGGKTNIVFPITYEEKVSGYLIVFETNRKLEEFDFFALEIAATFTLIEMKRRLQMRFLEERFTNDIIYDLITFKADNYGIINERAKLIGLDLRNKHVVVVFEVEDDTINQNTRESKAIFETYKDRLCAMIVGKIKESNPLCVCGRLSNSIIVFWPITNRSNDDYYQTIKKACKNVQHAIKERFKSVVITVGIGELANNSKEITRSFSEAKDVIKFGTTFLKNETVLGMNEIGILRLLCKAEDPKILTEIIPDSLMKLKEYDQSFNTELLTTLRTYLKCNTNAAKTSKEMYVHYKTIQYRLNRINEVTKIDLTDHNKRLELEMGFKIMEYLIIKEGAALN